MPAESKIYYRESLKERCFSYQIAHSYLEGRVEKQEIFSIDGQKLTIEELLVQDEVIRKIVREKGGPRVIIPEQHQFNSFFERYRLFKKIVLHGDDSLASLIFELDEKKEQIEKLQKEQESNERQLSCCQQNNDALVAVCRNAVQELQKFEKIVETQQRNLVPNTDLFVSYTDILSIIHRLTEELCVKLQQNLDTATISEASVERKAIEEIKIIDDCRKNTDELVVKRMAELKRLKEQAKTEIDQERDKAVMLIQQAGIFVKEIRNKAKTSFTRCIGCERCFIEPHIPKTTLYTAIQKTNGEVAPNTALALFDCSTQKNGSMGILVSTHAFYLFDGVGTPQPFWLHKSIELCTEFQKSNWRFFLYFLAILCVFFSVGFWAFSDVVNLDIDDGALKTFILGGFVCGVFAFIVAYLSCPGEVVIKQVVKASTAQVVSDNGDMKQPDKILMTLPGYCAEDMQNFCEAINQLCSVSTLAETQLQQIDKVILSLEDR